MSHNSGLREVLRDTTFRQKIAVGLKTSRRELLTYFSTQPLDFEPGTEFSYSNSGYDLLGMIIEKVTGMPYDKAIHKWIFKPLAMNHSGYAYAGLKSKLKTVGYDYVSKGRYVVAKNWDESWTYASGGLYSTAADLLKWNEGLKGNKVISAKSLEESTKIVKEGYGYGWFIDTLYDKKLIFHAGNLEGATSYFARIPTDDICIVMLNNQTSTVIETIASKIVAILNGKPYTLPVAKREIAIDTGLLDRYKGTYDISDNYATTVELVSGRLYLKTNNEAPIAIFPETETRFFVLDSHMVLTFNTDKAGKVTLVIKNGLATKIGDKKGE